MLVFRMLKFIHGIYLFMEHKKALVNLQLEMEQSILSPRFLQQG